MLDQPRSRKSKHRRLLGLVLILTGCGCLGSVRAAAVESASLKVEYSIAITAPPDKIWRIIGDFGDFGWVPVVQSTNATQGNEIGSMRTVEIFGLTLTERLTRYDAANMNYSYQIIKVAGNVEELPVSQYSSTIVVKKGANSTSVVTWRGSFKRIDSGAAPLPGEDDKAAVDAVDDVYKRGLTHLKALAEPN